MIQHSKQTIFLFFKILLVSSLLIANRIYAEPFYFLCGSDEDGCPDQQEAYCICIPINLELGNQAYCLDFDKMKCQQLTDHPHCENALIFENQGACIATIFQSEPYPPCRIVSQSFCVSHSITIAKESGDFKDAE